MQCGLYLHAEENTKWEGCGNLMGMAGSVYSVAVLGVYSVDPTHRDQVIRVTSKNNKLLLFPLGYHFISLKQ